MNNTAIGAYPWLQLQTWRYLWLHLIWFFPLSYAVHQYQGHHFYFVISTYICILMMMILYSAWQTTLYIQSPLMIRKIINKLSRTSAPPLYIMFNLTQSSLKINTHYTEILSEEKHHIRWYQSPDAEFLELSPQAIVSLKFQKQLLQLLLRHIAKTRFGGIVIQISSQTLMQNPPYNTIVDLIHHINKIGYHKALPFQVMIYNHEAPDANDAVILRPESAHRQHPLLWKTLRSSFQNLIDELHHQAMCTNIIEPTRLDLLMNPTENLLTSISENTNLSCLAIHLIGFSIPTTSTDTDNPLLHPYHPKYWPKFISKSALVLIILSGCIVLKEHYDLSIRLHKQNHLLKQTDNTLITHQLLQYINENDNYWSHLLRLQSPLPALDSSQIKLSFKRFQTIPVTEQIQAIQSALIVTPEFINPNEVSVYFEKIAKLTCTLRETSESTDCQNRALADLVHDWSKKQLNMLEQGILPVDLDANIDPSIRLNQLDYLLKHPEMIGEHVHARLGLLESMLRQHPHKDLSDHQADIQALVTSFKQSGSYDAIQYLIERQSSEFAVPQPEITAINDSDRRLIDALIPLEKISDAQPAILEDAIQGWDILYRSYLPLQGCYPLQQGSTQDCDANAFINFFKPKTGTFDTLWQKHFEAYVTPSSSGEDIPEFLPSIAPYLSEEIIERYMQARIIQSVFFESNLSAISLRIRPEISERDLQADLMIGKKTYSLHANGHVEIPLVWDYTSDHNISIYMQLHGKDKKIEYFGPWAILKLMQNHLISGSNYNSIQIHELGQTLRLNLIGHPHIAPWYTSLYDGFELPQNILKTASQNSISFPPQDDVTDSVETQNTIDMD